MTLKSLVERFMTTPFQTRGDLFILKMALLALLLMGKLFLNQMRFLAAAPPVTKRPNDEWGKHWVSIA